MNSLKKIIVVLAFVLMGFGSAQAASNFSLSLGTDDFYVSVGNYDYLPYAYDVDPGYTAPPINFNNMMSDYGQWVYVPTFGQVWRPYVDAGWRPYTNGHWIYTSYGPTWQGYEPWAWAGYHYGNWIWNDQFGWVWIPGYDWHPGRVIWSRSYDTVGWMPAPPPGYDYSRGYISYRGNVNQFTYDDPDFYNNGNGYYSGYNQGYDNLYYNPAYNNISGNLWVFIGNNHYGYNNYADYYLDRDYTRDVFARRAVRINSRPIQRAQLEQVTRTKINEVPVKVKEVDADRRRVKMVIPEGEDANVRANANKTVRNVIAPAFAEKQRQFKGTNSANEKAVAKIFNQENKQPKVETVSTDTVINQAKEQNQKRDQERVRITRAQIDQVDKKDKENKNNPNNRGKNNQEPASTPGVSSGPTVKEPGNSKPNQLPKEQNNNPYNKQPKTYQPNKEQPQDRDKDSQFDSSNKKNKPVNEQQPPTSNEDKVKKQSEEKIKQADQDQQRAKQKMKEADDTRRQAEDQLKKSQEVSGPNQDDMKKQAEDQMNQADQKKQEAEQELNKAQEDKKQAVTQTNKATDDAKKKDQNKKKKDKDKDKDKPPSRSH